MILKNHYAPRTRAACYSFAELHGVELVQDISLHVHAYAPSGFAVEPGNGGQHSCALADGGDVRWASVGFYLFQYVEDLKPCIDPRCETCQG